MDYIDQLKQFSIRAAQLSKIITTEEATKNALILPFFQMLGYDVFNPLEFVPEYTADVGIKKGEKVDYAIVIDGKPTIFVEAKWCGEKLESHDSQLFRYFATCSAKLAILTNGIIYRFYTDLDEKNKMDLTPFMEFNVLDVKDNLVPELKRFHRTALNVDDIFSAASDLKYTTAIKQLLAKQTTDPDEGFLAYVLKEVYPGRKTGPVMDKFKDIIRKSFAQYITDLMNEKFKSMLEPKEQAAGEKKPEEAAPEAPAAAEGKPAVVTTESELECYIIVKTLLHDIVPANRITYKDTVYYFSIILDNKVTKWVCRLQLDGRKKWLIIPDVAKKEARYALESNDDLFQYRTALLESAKALL